MGKIIISSAITNHEKYQSCITIIYWYSLIFPFVTYTNAKTDGFNTQTYFIQCIHHN